MRIHTMTSGTPTPTIGLINKYEEIWVSKRFSRRKSFDWHPRGYIPKFVFYINHSFQCHSIQKYTEHIICEGLTTQRWRWSLRNPFMRFLFFLVVGEFSHYDFVKKHSTIPKIIFMQWQAKKDMFKMNQKCLRSLRRRALEFLKSFFS